MTPLQFSLRKLLLGIAFVAVGCAALLNAGPWCLAIVWWLTIGLLVAAILLTLYRRHERRAFWLGLAIVGWCYVLAGSDRLPALVGARQLPQQITSWAYERLPDSRRQQYAGAVPNPPTLVYQSTVVTKDYDPVVPWSGGPTTVYIPTYTSRLPVPPAANPSFIPLGEFVSIGEALWLLLFAYLGGQFGHWLYRSEQKREAVPHASP